MIKYIIFATVLVFRLFYQPSNAKDIVAPFAAPELITMATNLSPTVINFIGNINNDRILLQWQVNENEGAEQFEIEKSTDGKNFSLTALVFGTDKTENDSYWFYEKTKKTKVYYRVKMITKAKKIEYSPVILINPKS